MNLIVNLCKNNAIMPFQSKYTEEEISTALLVLRALDNNYSQAAKKIGVNRTTLMSWDKKYKEIPEKSPVETMDIEEIIEEMATVGSAEVMTADFIGNVTEAKNLIIERLMELIPNSANIDYLTKALKTLHDITGGGQPDDNGKPGSFTQINNYIQYLNQELIESGYDGHKRTNRIKDDQQESTG